MKTCSVKGCNGKHVAKGYCNKHYIQMKRRGKILDRSIKDPNEIIEYEDHAEIVMHNKQHEETGRAIIDLNDVDKVRGYKWSLRKTGYVISGGGMFLHRLIMNPPDNMVIDHINHNPLDNRKENLRICTQQQNSMNKAISSNNTSGVTGVYFDKRRNKWMTYITYNNRRIFLGYFNTKEDAIETRRAAEIKYFGDYRNDN